MSKKYILTVLFRPYYEVSDKLFRLFDDRDLINLKLEN